MSKPRIEIMLPTDVVQKCVERRIDAERIIDALKLEARKLGATGKEVPVLVLERGKEPYFSLAEDDGTAANDVMPEGGEA